MKILFLCGSLEPGRDGVGDYTRMLACELIKNGHGVVAMAINDRHINQIFKDFQGVGIIKLKVYRIPSNMAATDRFDLVEKWMGELKPNWVSLQFVPFSFHRKGVPFLLPLWLIRLRQSNFRWHIMFHELWVSDAKFPSFKEFVIRGLQIIIIKGLLKELKSPIINTSNTQYYNMLKKIGYDSSILPIFSNLPKGRQADTLNICNRESKIVGVFFGNIQAVDNPIDRIKLLADRIKKEMNKDLFLVQMGYNRSSKTKDFLHEVSEKLRLQVVSTGFLEAQEAANILATADCGLSNYPHDLIQKSGSISSMLFNDLPVVLLSGNGEYERLNTPEISHLEHIYKMSDFIYQKKNFAYKYSSENMVKKLQHQFGD